MANENELLLVPRLDVVKVDDSKLKSDIESLASKVNSKGWLNLSASIDTTSLKKAIESIPKNDLPKLTLDTIIDTSKLSKNIQTALKAIQTSEINLDVGGKTAERDLSNIQKVKQTYRELINIIKERNAIELEMTQKTNALENSSLGVAQLDEIKRRIPELIKQYDVLDERFQNLFKTGVTQDPMAMRVLTMKDITNLSHEYEKGQHKINIELAKQTDLKNKQVQSERELKLKIEERAREEAHTAKKLQEQHIKPLEISVDVKTEEAQAKIQEFINQRTNLADFKVIDYDVKNAFSGDEIEKQTIKVNLFNESLNETVKITAKLNRDAQRLPEIDVSRKTNIPTPEELRKQAAELESLGHRLDSMKEKWSAMNLDPNHAVEWQRLKDAVSEAIDAGDAGKVKELTSAGLAMENNNMMMDTAAKKAEQLAASFERFSVSVLDSRLIKGGLEGLRWFVDILTELNNATGGLPVIIISITALTAAMKALSMSNAGQNFLGFFKDIGKPKIVGFKFIFRNVAARLIAAECSFCWLSCVYSRVFEYQTDYL